MSGWNQYCDITKSLLDRFVTGHSITLLGEHFDNKPVGKGSAKRDSLRYSIPKSDTTKRIRECFADDRRSMPKEGIIFPDGSVLTILFEAKGLPFEKLLSPVMHHIAISDPDEKKMIGYVEKYSYCFYPNSKLADTIGYFRYDFHAEKMGDGDLGDHSYFHFHRQLDECFRHATGPILDFGEVVSGLERILAPKEREARLQKTFEAGEYLALTMDLTLEGIQKLREKIYPAKSAFKNKGKFDAFLEGYLD